MKKEPNGLDDRGEFAKAMDLASQIVTACLLMVLPCVGGFYLDRYLATGFVFMIVGLVFGCVAGIFQMIKVINSIPS